MKIMKSVKRKVFSLRENRKSVTVGHHAAGDHFILLVYDMLPTSQDSSGVQSLSDRLFKFLESVGKFSNF